MKKFFIATGVIVTVLLIVTNMSSLIKDDKHRVTEEVSDWKCIIDCEPACNQWYEQVNHDGSRAYRRCVFTNYEVMLPYLLCTKTKTKIVYYDGEELTRRSWNVDRNEFRNIDYDMVDVECKTTVDEVIALPEVKK